MKVIVLLAAVCGTLLGSPQSTSSNIGSSSDSSSSISNVIAGKIAGLLTNIYDLLGERAKDLPACSFPFIHNGVTYHNCTTDDDYYGMYWCSTKTDDQGIHAYNEWRHCEESDGLLSDDASVASNQTLDGLVLGDDVLTTVGGGCAPPSWVYYQDRCLRFVQTELPWAKADDYCKGRGGYLAKVTNTTSFTSFMISQGLVNDEYEVTYLWQIRSQGGTCKDLTLYKDRKPSIIVDVSCEKEIFFVCERKLGQIADVCYDCANNGQCSKSSNNCGGIYCTNPGGSHAIYPCSDVEF